MRRPRLINTGSSGIRKEMALMGVDPMGIDIMEEKARHHLIRLDDVDLRAALILKQDMLSLGGEAALCRDAAGLGIKRTPVLLMGTTRQMRGLVAKMGGQPFKLTELAVSIGELLDGVRSAPRYVVRGEDLLSGTKIPVMGILNVTPDSFSDGGRYAERDKAVARGLEMVSQGADIIDIGGESTRPGASQVNAQQEMERVLPVIEDLVKNGVSRISIDTTKAAVAEKAIEAGACIINDISAMTFDPEMVEVAAGAGVSVILMHTRGRPESMQNDLHYEDLLGEVCTFLEDATDRALGSGIPAERICLDPGIGFGKSVKQNLELIARVGELRSLGCAVLLGASRKSFIGGLTASDVDQRMPGSIAATVAAVMNGADMVRVHDVAETVQAMAIVSGLRETATG